MQGDYVRYAINWIPLRGTALAEFGCAWTGWCADAAQRQPLARAFQKVGDPGYLGRVGLHAPLSAPFQLARAHSLWGLERAIEAVAAVTPFVALPRFMIEETDGALALVIGDDVAGFRLLLERLERQLEPIRKAPVAAVQRFRVPLTCERGMRAPEPARHVLAPFLDPILRRAQVVGDLALMGDPGQNRPWRVIERFALARSIVPPEKGPAAMACTGPTLIAPLEERNIAV